ncbi:hypothetical protein ASG88_09110 [Nocardioides sp. Soil777]|nr:hypothetical protein ASG88_09110 [Nocardioides sp. Soil777]
MLLGAALEIFFKAWGAAAAIAVAFSDAQTWAGKIREGLAAVPTLTEEYRRTQYVVEHRAQIEDAIDHLNTQTPPQAEMEASIERSRETLDELQIFDERVAEASDLDYLKFWANIGDFRDAWEAIPERESLRQLIEVTGPAVEQARVLVPTYYGGILTLTDNFSREERGSTITAMAVLVAVMFLLGRAVAFAVRRGRPGFIAQALQWLGARTFPRWYSHNVAYALNKPLYAHARTQVHRELMADPHAALDPESFRELEDYFAERGRPRLDLQTK